MKKQMKKIIFASPFLLGLLLLSACSSTIPLLSDPIGDISQTTVKASGLSEVELRSWSHMDLLMDSIPGVSLDRAYRELVRPDGETIVVAVIDSGIDITHEDLSTNVSVSYTHLTLPTKFVV